LPFAVLSLPITRGINPELNRLKATENHQAFSYVYTKGLNLYLLMFFPVSVILVCCSPEIIDLVYRRGSFDENSLHLTSLAFSMYSFGLLPMSLVGYYKRVLSLFNKNKFALNISLISAVLNIFFAIIFVKTTSLGHEGIALASSLAFFVNMWVMHNYTRKELKDFIKESQRSVIINIILLCILSAILIFMIFYFDLNFYQNKSQSLISLSIKTLIITAVFVLFYFLNKNLKPIFLGFFRRPL
jgi:putative peptidoglycan lipid II flippase